MDPCGKAVTRRDCGVDGGGTEAMVDQWHHGRKEEGRCAWGEAHWRQAEEAGDRVCLLLASK